MTPVLLLISTIAALTAPADAEIGVKFTGKLCSRGECASNSTIGAEITGVTDFDALTDAEISTIRQAMTDYGVIYFHGAGHLLTPDVQLRFAERFGAVLPEVSRVPRYVEKGVHQSTHSVRHDARTGLNVTESVNTMVEANKPANKVWRGKEVPDRVARLVREPGDPFAFGEGYHADVTFFDQPPFFTFLVARELPGGKDDTHFIDVARAYDNLDAETVDTIVGLNAYHNDSAGMVATHPVVRTHPESGRRVIYVNSHFTHHIAGYGDAEGKRLLETVFDHIEIEQPIFKFKWQCDGDDRNAPECMHVLMWDNRRLQHTATTPWANDPVLKQRRRELHRVTISGGEAPYFRPVTAAAAKSCRAHAESESCGAHIALTDKA